MDIDVSSLEVLKDLSFETGERNGVRVHALNVGAVKARGVDALTLSAFAKNNQYKAKRIVTWAAARIEDMAEASFEFCSLYITRKFLVEARHRDV